jgi:hypothetical protein
VVVSLIPAEACFSGAPLIGAAEATVIPAKPIAAVAAKVNKVFRIEGSCGSFLLAFSQREQQYHDPMPMHLIRRYESAT